MAFAASAAERTEDELCDSVTEVNAVSDARILTRTALVSVVDTVAVSVVALVFAI